MCQADMFEWYLEYTLGCVCMVPEGCGELVCIMPDVC